MKSEQRWIEIKFAYLCFDLYNSLRDYILTTNYIEFLSEISNVEKSQSLRLLQKVNQINSLRPSNAEYVCIARQNKQTIDSIIHTLNISKSTYIQMTHETDMSIDYPPHCSSFEITIMKELLNAHQKLKDAGL